uniref:Uncharacterized protein n=1 Tax=Arundo donax TaxID=35708 RepID=A0A0A9E935_ARUDO
MQQLPQATNPESSNRPKSFRHYIIYMKTINESSTTSSFQESNSSTAQPAASQITEYYIR